MNVQIEYTNVVNIDQSTKGFNLFNFINLLKYKRDEKGTRPVRYKAPAYNPMVDWADNLQLR